MNRLVRDPVRKTLFAMAVPMLAGTFAMNAYGLTDAWFVSKLGLPSQTAIGYIFPVMMFFNCLAMGFGAGVTAHVSHLLGQGHRPQAARAVTHAMIFMTALAVVTTSCGLLGIGPMFRALGADETTRSLIGRFMRVWYLGAPFMYLSSMGNGILISAGDSRAAGRFMMLGTLLNLLMNPVFIFGLAGFPAMGIRGSAVATVVSQAFTVLWMLNSLSRKHHLVATGDGTALGWAASTGSIVRLGVPSVLSMLLIPIASAVVTRLLSRFGNEPVAACGVAARIEMFAFVIPMALGMTIMPFISLNYGAGRLDRVRETLGLATRFALLYGAFISVVFFAAAPFMAGMFSDDPKVIGALVDYIRIISFGYGMTETHRYCGFVLTGLHKPVSALMLNAIRVLVLLVPLSVLGAYVGGVRGVFFGRLGADLLAGGVGIFWAYRACAASHPVPGGKSAEPEPLVFVE